MGVADHLWFQTGKDSIFLSLIYIPSYHCPDKGATMPEATHSAHRQFTIYKNGFIYTMEGDKPTTVECLVVGTPSFGGKNRICWNFRWSTRTYEQKGNGV